MVSSREIPRSRSFSKRDSRLNAFTIVELLIVIVIIGILAAVTIVTYNGMQERAQGAQVQAMANQAAKKVKAYQIENGSPPASLADVGLTAPTGMAYDYTVFGDWYCVSARTTATDSATTTGVPRAAMGYASQGDCSRIKAESTTIPVSAARRP